LRTPKHIKNNNNNKKNQKGMGRVGVESKRGMREEEGAKLLPPLKTGL
jgi:hypothetical protein